MKPFLRWAGSKKKLLPELKKYWNDDFEKYIEPFAGSSCFYFSINPKSSIISDINYELINTYIQIKNNPKTIHSILCKHEINKDNYYRIRELDLDKMSKQERAARFLFLNRYCFNGLYRTNKQGKFNVPYGHLKTGSLPTLEKLLSYSNKLKDTKIFCKDFQQLVNDEAQKGNFVYLDPPYAVRNKKIFHQYSPDTFGINDLFKLRETIDLIEERGAYFLLSYAKCDEIMEIFSDIRYRTVETRRNISGFNKHRRIEQELLFTNIKS